MCQIYTHPLHAEEGVVATLVACRVVSVEKLYTGEKILFNKIDASKA